MSLKAKVEAVIYAAEEPITLDQLSVLLKDTVLAELAAARENAAIEEADFAAESEESPCESTSLPELDSSDEEPNGLEPGPLMPQEAAPELANTPEPASIEDTTQESKSFTEDDEPLFATDPRAQTEAAPEESASVAASVTGDNASRANASPGSPSRRSPTTKPYARACAKFLPNWLPTIAARIAAWKSARSPAASAWPPSHSIMMWFAPLPRASNRPFVSRLPLLRPSPS